MSENSLIEKFMGRSCEGLTFTLKKLRLDKVFRVCIC